MAESEFFLPADSLRISHGDYEAMMEHLRNVYPLEGCGLLSGKDGLVTRVHSIKNRLMSAYAYEMDPHEQLDAFLDMEEKEEALLAIYHSHPQGPDKPSLTDISKSYYPEAAYVIVSFENMSEPQVRAFFIDGNYVREISLEII